MNNRLTLFILKLPIALSMLGHGLVRLPKLSGFAHWMVTFMERSYLPRPMILGFGYLVPIIEMIIGFVLLTEYYTKTIALLGIMLMALFIFGNTTIENWDPISSQLIHAAYFFGLIIYIDNKNKI